MRDCVTERPARDFIEHISGFAMS
ncbi:hypothetical protein PCAR4_570345 [Paraburkholderia caribensis]|nr:hypothetical protein PCAR4_570345 [Paraburkholderia caribensis]